MRARTFCWMLALAPLYLLLSAPALAAATQSNLRLTITSDLKVSVADQWSGMKRAVGKYDYFSAAREHGTIPVDIKAGGFKVNFETESYLRSEGGLYYLVTPDFYYAGGPLDVKCTLEYPATLHFLDAKPVPDKTAAGRLEWDLKDCSHRFILARFEPLAGAPTPPAPSQSQPPVQRITEPGGTLVNSSELPILTTGELPQNPDEVLTEMRNVLAVAQMSHSTDPQFIRVMDKVLAKFYYLFDKDGQLKPRTGRPEQRPATGPKSTVKPPAAASVKTKAAPPVKPTTSPIPRDSSDDGTPRFRGIW